MRDVAVFLNGCPATVPAGTTVANLVRDAAGVDREPRGVAVALNGTVVPRSRWGATVVSPADRVELLVAAQGG